MILYFHCQLNFLLFVFVVLSATVSAIVNWSPCTSLPGGSVRPRVVAVEDYVYVHCGDAGPTVRSYLMQCPGNLVWNPSLNGCADVTGQLQSPPRLIGPLNEPPRSINLQTQHGSPLVNLAGLQPGVAPPAVVLSQRPPIQLDPDLIAAAASAGLLPHPHTGSKFNPTTLVDQDGGATQLTSNPCVVDDRGTLSTVKFHPHPSDWSKYLECVPQDRVIIVRQCQPVGSTLWSQSTQNCVSTSTILDQRRPAQHHVNLAPGLPQLGSPEVFVHRHNAAGNLPPVTLQGPSVLHLPDTLTIASDDQHSAVHHNHHHQRHSHHQHNHRPVHHHHDLDLSHHDHGPHFQTNPCFGGPPFYRPHPSDARLYIQCGAGGKIYVQACPPGLRWNQSVLTCDRTIPGTAFGRSRRLFRESSER